MDISAITPYITSALSGIAATLITAFFERRKIARDIANSRTMPLTARVRRRPWVLPAIVGLICLLLGGAGGYILTSPTLFSSCPPIAKMGVSITSPVEGSMVQRTTVVRGNACHIPEGQFLWVVVVSETNSQAYFPQAGPIGISSDGAWSTLAYIGDPTSRNVGHSYRLISVLLDQAGNALFRATLKKPAYERKVFQLPADAQLMTDILVLRA